MDSYIVMHEKINIISNIIPFNLFLQAEKDSKKRLESINRVCRRRNVTNLLEPLTDRRDREKARRRFTLFEHLVVNEKYKVIYCYLPKVSTTNMKRIFLVLEGLYSSITQVEMLDRQLVRLNNQKFTEEQRQYMLKNFYRFTIVRDPFERLVSAFLHKFRRESDITIFASLGKPNRNNTKTPIAGRNVSFTEFALNAINNPPWMLNMHWMPYEDLCHPCHVKYDFIGSIDNLDRDVTHAMRQIHANETKHHVIRNSRARTKTKRTTADSLKELSREYFDQLLAVYKTDHELFGYPLPKYDTLDKRYPA